MNTMLEVNDLSVDYGGGRVVNDVSFAIAEGEIVAFLGPNGAGKTSALKAISGLVRADSGVVKINGTNISRLSAEKRSKAGIFLVPDDRGLFPPLPVHAHLSLASHTRSTTECRALVEEHFAPLVGRWNLPAGSLSGGEAQMLSLAMAMLAKPKVLMIDELSFGLAPIVVRRLLKVIRDIADQTGVAVLMVEQLVDLALAVADRGIILRREIILTGKAADLAADQHRLHEAYFGASAVGRAGNAVAADTGATTTTAASPATPPPISAAVEPGFAAPTEAPE
jgi:branched-chain amino acid transport system ATP-binding protein